MSISTINPGNYVEAHLPPAIIKRLESGVFQSLCTHLRERSDEVPNIDLMTVSGFCRNCLSKWLVIEARKLSDSIQKKDGSSSDSENIEEVVRALDAMGYDEAAQYVYGMMYPEWKKRHAQKASVEQMEKFNNSKPLWASHDKKALAKRSEEKPSAVVCPVPHKDGATTSTTTTTTKASLLSNVCCEDIDNVDNTKNKNSADPSTTSTAQKTSSGNTFAPPVLPQISFSIGVLTVSDRAFSGGYETGDLSGPAVTEAIESILKSSGATAPKAERTETKIVPDKIDAIQKVLTEWSSASASPAFDLIVTTGGTGFSPRDVTPEATEAILERSCYGLMSFCSLSLENVQPLASLSRGTAGVRGRSMIVNLPGNPRAVQEILPILLPLALHAVADMKQMD